MLDQLRRDIQSRLDELLSEADKLRHALAALTSRGSATPAKANGSSSATRSRRRAPAASPTRTPTRKAAQPRRSAKSQSSTAAPAPAAPSPAGEPARTAPGATKTAVLAALASGTAMTASDVANATGLGRASVSTTLSKLAKNGEVRKAARGYQIAGQPTSGSAAATTPKAKA